MAIGFNLDTTEQLETILLNQIRKILKKPVADYIKSELIKEYQAQVYSYISSGWYERRNSLLQPDTYRVEEETIGNMATVVIDSAVAPSSSAISPVKYPIDENAYLADWIENGDIVNPWSNKRYPWTRKRPVFKTVENKLKSDKAIERIIQDELAKVGFDVW